MHIFQITKNFVLNYFNSHSTLASHIPAKRQEKLEMRLLGNYETVYKDSQVYFIDPDPS